VAIDGERRPLPDGSGEALLKGLGSVVGLGRTLWPNGGRTLDALILGGGGATMLGPALIKEWKQAICLDDPQLSGARGFAAIAAAELARQR
jgi:hypothetical protein